MPEMLSPVTTPWRSFASCASFLLTAPFSPLAREKLVVLGRPACRPPLHPAQSGSNSPRNTLAPVFRPLFRKACLRMTRRYLSADLGLSKRHSLKTGRQHSLTVWEFALEIFFSPEMDRIIFRSPPLCPCYRCRVSVSLARLIFPAVSVP